MAKVNKTHKMFSYRGVTKALLDPHNVIYKGAC